MDHHSTPVFIYWHQGWTQAPDVVQACLTSWQHNHRSSTRYQIVPISHNTVSNWLSASSDEDQNKLNFFLWRLKNRKRAGSLAFYTDYLRLVLTEAHKGIWIDSTVFCTRPLDDWLPQTHHALMPLSISPDRLFEVWFIDNRAGDSLISKWKTQLSSPHFAEHHYTKYIDDWNSKPLSISHWLLKVSRRSWVYSAIVWNTYLTRKILKIRPYFMVNYALQKVLMRSSHFKKRYNHILPVDMFAMICLEFFEDIDSDEATINFKRRTHFIKLSHKKDWSQPNKHGLILKDLLLRKE